MPKIDEKLVAPANDYATGEQALVFRDKTTDEIINAVILTDGTGKILRPIEEDSRLDILINEIREIKTLLALALE
jgi:hypothetical protein